MTGRDNDNRGGARSGSRRVATVAVLVVALLAAGFTRHVAESQRGSAAAASAQAGGTLSKMNTFALALLLGGLRGPLVMMLWTSSEAQKTEKNLEDFDTKVEWIRMLQPEFDTVHIFQIWNKAYNISVQMASNANKYLTILDALEYAKSVDKERPSNINMLYAIGSIYFDKLGGASEKQYYRKRVREETLPHKSAQKLTRGDPNWRPLQHEQMLDAQGMILPEYLAPRYPRPQGHEGEWNDGSELQYLAQFQPFKYGLSPQAIGFNYFKRAQVLQATSNQRHAQISDLVIDSRPPLALRMWGEEELERARRVELAAFGKEIPAERIDMELPTADVGLQQAPAESAIREALFSYDFAATVLQESLREYDRHLRGHSLNRSTYEFHIEHVKNMLDLARGDRDYLAAQLASGEQRQKLVASAIEHYRSAMTRSEYIIVRYHIDDELVPLLFPPGITRLTADKLKPEQYRPIIFGARQLLQRPGMYDALGEDRREYELYAARAEQRLAQLEKK